MDTKCWKKGFSTTQKREYNINVEKGTSQWGRTNYLTPEGWEMHYAKGGVEIYYGNTVTGETQWEQPPFIKPPPLPPGWESSVTDCGNYYFINKSLNISQWEIPVIKSPFSKSPVVKEILEDRVLKWVANSCYLDSSLFCLFAGPKDFIDDILYTDLDEKRKEIERNTETSFFCGDTLDKDIVNRKRVQNELRYIAESITGKSDRIVKKCTDFRKSISVCRPKAGVIVQDDGSVLQGDEDQYHTGNIGDPGEFLTYLFKILQPLKKAVRSRITYATNDLNEISKSKLIETSRRDEEISIVNVVDNNILLNVPEEGVQISQFMEETEDSGELTDDPDPKKSNLFRSGGKTYKRRIQITSIQQSPIIIVSIKRALLGGGICETPIFPDEHIFTQNRQKFVFYGVIMYNAGHYTCIAKYGKIWYHYDDNNPTNRIKKYNTFEDAAADDDNINPYTHGTQYFYKPSK